MALIVTGAGGVCLLVGLLLLGRMAGSYDVDAVLAARDAIQADPAYLLALILILIAAFTKSAQLPFHFWLPHAMASPTPVSAYIGTASCWARLFPSVYFSFFAFSFLIFFFFLFFFF